MSTVINRSTREVLHSVNEPDYPVESWIHDPDLSAVAGTDRRWWVIEGDTVRPATTAEMDAQLPDYKTAVVAAVVEIAKRKIEAAVADYAAGEMAGWESAEAQAHAYIDEAQAETTSPDLYAEAQHRNVTTQNIVTRVLGNATAFRALKAAIAGHRGKLTDEVNACTSVAQVDAIDIDAGWAV